MHTRNIIPCVGKIVDTGERVKPCVTVAPKRGRSAGRAKIGSPCVFPFIHKGKTWNQCVFGGARRGTSWHWCSTQVFKCTLPLKEEKGQKNFHTFRHNFSELFTKGKKLGGLRNEGCDLEKRPKIRLNRPKIKSSHIPNISQFVLFPLESLDHCNAQVNNTGHHVKGNWGHCSYDCPLQDPLKEADDDRWWCSGRYVTSYLLTNPPKHLS